MSQVDDFSVTPEDELPASRAEAEAEALALEGGASMSQVEEKSVEWLWPGWIPTHGLSLVEGREGAGKSLFVAKLIAAITGGALWPDDAGGSVHGDVLLFASEDDPERVLAGRFTKAGVDKDKVFLWREVPEDVSFLDVLDVILRRRRPAAVVVDPIVDYLPADADESKPAAVNALLSGLKRLSNEYNTAIIAVHHSRKYAQQGTHDQAGLGTIRFRTNPRAVIQIVHDRDEDLLVVAKSKSSYGGRRGVVRGRIDADGQGRASFERVKYYPDELGDDALQRALRSQQPKSEDRGPSLADRIREAKDATEHGLTYAQLAAELGASSDSIRMACVRHDIPRRKIERDEAERLGLEIPPRQASVVVVLPAKVPAA